MTKVSALGGERDGFPSPLLVSGRCGDSADFLTQGQLANACLSLGLRRRFPIPVCGYRYVTGTAVLSILLPFVAHREDYSRTGRLVGYYAYDCPGGGALELEVGLSSPSTLSKVWTLPASSSADGTEFAIDFEMGDGEAGDAGAIQGYVLFTTKDKQSSGTHTLALYGIHIEPAPALQVTLP